MVNHTSLPRFLRNCSMGGALTTVFLPMTTAVSGTETDKQGVMADRFETQSKLEAENVSAASKIISVFLTLLSAC